MSCDVRLAFNERAAAVAAALILALALLMICAMLPSPVWRGDADDGELPLGSQMEPFTPPGGGYFDGPM